MRSSRAPLVSSACRALCAAALLSACAPPGELSPDLAPSEQVQINAVPTGSIPVPSLCERASVDQRVSYTGVDSFSFLWTGSHYEVVYADLIDHDIFVVHLSPAGTMLDAPILVEATAGLSRLPTIAQTPTGFVVAWQDLDAQSTVRVHALDLAGRPVGSGRVVALSRGEQSRPVLASSPNGVAISWMDQAQASAGLIDAVGDSTVYVGLLGPDLVLRTDVPVRQISPSAKTGYPWLAGDQERLGLLWSEEGSSHTDTFFSSLDGALSSPVPNNVRDPDVINAALLGRLLLTDFGFLAAWEDHRTGAEEIYMSLLDPLGRRYAGGLIEEPNTGSANWPHLAWTGSAAGVVYYQFRSGRPQIFMTFIDRTGTRIGGGADTQISNTAVWARFPDVVWNGSEFAIMWVDFRDGRTELYFNRALCKQPAPI